MNEEKIEKEPNNPIQEMIELQKQQDEWAKKNKGYDSYAEWYLDNMD